MAKRYRKLSMITALAALGLGLGACGKPIPQRTDSVSAVLLRAPPHIRGARCPALRAVTTPGSRTTADTLPSPAARATAATTTTATFAGTIAGGISRTRALA